MKATLEAALGLGLLAALATGTVNVVGAAAISSGHFVSDSTTNETTQLLVTEDTNSTHKVQFISTGNTVECHRPTYNVHLMTSNTTQQVTATGNYEGCTTGAEEADIDMKGCHYIFTSRAGTSHATVHFKCPVGQKAQIVTPSCTTSIGEQTPAGGVTYQNVLVNTPLGPKHSVTVNITVSGIAATQHGVCQLFGTVSTTAKLQGAVLVHGIDTKVIPVNVTHT
jgi:hypothetical protein